MMLVKKWQIGTFHEGWSDGYYNVVLHTRLALHGLYLARVSVERVDSGEKVGGIQRSGGSVEDAVNCIKVTLADYISTLPRPPVEWGRLELRRLLADYRTFKDELIRVGIRAKSLDSSSGPESASVQQIYRKSMDFTIRRSTLFTQRLAAMAEQDQVDLMTSAEPVYQDFTNPWHLDDYDSRAALFEFIINPSDNVRDAHQAHLARGESSTRPVSTVAGI